MRPTPASKGRDVGAFEAVIARALALAPGDRHRNAGELLAALDQAAGGGPAAPIVQAPRKRMTTIVTLGALVVLAVALAASLTWRARKVPVAARPTVVRAGRADRPDARAARRARGRTGVPRRPRRPGGGATGVRCGAARPAQEVGRAAGLDLVTGGGAGEARGFLR